MAAIVTNEMLQDPAILMTSKNPSLSSGNKFTRPRYSAGTGVVVSSTTLAQPTTATPLMPAPSSTTVLDNSSTQTARKGKKRRTPKNKVSSEASGGVFPSPIDLRQQQTSQDQQSLIASLQERTQQIVNAMAAMASMATTTTATGGVAPVMEQPTTTPRSPRRRRFNKQAKQQQTGAMNEQLIEVGSTTTISATGAGTSGIGSVTSGTVANTTTTTPSPSKNKSKVRSHSAGRKSRSNSIGQLPPQHLQQQDQQSFVSGSLQRSNSHGRYSTGSVFVDQSQQSFNSATVNQRAPLLPSTSVSGSSAPPPFDNSTRSSGYRRAFPRSYGTPIPVSLSHRGGSGMNFSHTSSTNTTVGAFPASGGPGPTGAMDPINPFERNPYITRYYTKPGASNEYVSREIFDYYQRNRQTNERFNSKQIMRQGLENTLKQAFPQHAIKLFMVGSSTNGIGDNASTVDICIMAKKRAITPVVSSVSESDTPATSTVSAGAQAEVASTSTVEPVSDSISATSVSSTTDEAEELAKLDSVLPKESEQLSSSDSDSSFSTVLDSAIADLIEHEKKANEVTAIDTTTVGEKKNIKNKDKNSGDSSKSSFSAAACDESKGSEKPNSEPSSELESSSKDNVKAKVDGEDPKTQVTASCTETVATKALSTTVDEHLTIEQIEHCLRSKNFATNIITIPAKVPVIKFRDQITKLDITLNLNQDVSIRNTQLIRDYAKMDWRFPYLAMILKQWARENRICSAIDKTISSYSWTLMVIHFCQICEPPVLPCLQKMIPRRYDTRNSIDQIVTNWRRYPKNWRSNNTHNLRQLMKAMFRYYGYVFAYDQHVISVREGKVLDRTLVQQGIGTGQRRLSTSTSSTTTVVPTVEQAKVDPSNVESTSTAAPSTSVKTTDPTIPPPPAPNHGSQWNTFLCVEEPFTRTNTTRSVHDKEKFDRIIELFRTSSNALRGVRISLFNVLADDLEFPITY